MNKYSIAIIALILGAFMIMPVSAVWHNGNWLTDEQYEKVTDGATVVHNSKTGVDSVYRDNNPVNDVKGSVDSMSCKLKGNLRTGYNTLTAYVNISNNADPSHGEVSIPVLPDGTFDFRDLTYGNFTLRIPAPMGNGGQEEKVQVVCNPPGGEIYPQSELIGHGISSSDEVCSPSYTITSATYGFGHVSCHERTITHHSYKPGYHMEWRIMVGESKWGHCDYSHSEWSEWADSIPRTYGFNPCIRTETRWAKHIPECVTDGNVIDVTSNVQSVASGGHSVFRFMFDNSHNPGGIFDETGSELLSHIKDPAQGFVKNVHISYENGCGMSRVINTQEYCVIDLASGTTNCGSND